VAEVTSVVWHFTCAGIWKRGSIGSKSSSSIRSLIRSSRRRADLVRHFQGDPRVNSEMVDEHGSKETFLKLARTLSQRYSAHCHAGSLVLERERERERGRERKDEQPKYEWANQFSGAVFARILTREILRPHARSI